MNTLCFMSNLTSSEWAAWVQAIGSVGAIIAAAWIAIHQAKLQHRSALELHETERRSAQTEIAKTLGVLAANAAKAMMYIMNQLPDRDSVHRAAEGLTPCNIGEMRRIDKYLGDIPLHTIPHSMVTVTMILGATVRQFKEKVETALRLHREMDGSMFDDFFNTLRAMNASIADTCADIEREIEIVERRGYS